MSYDPFQRGPLPVGVRSVTLRDTTRDRDLPTELWYPATDAVAGRDIDPASQDHYKVMPAAPDSLQAAVRDAETRPGRFPVIVFSHGWGGHRRQTTHLCSHFASHGYVVASVDHVGNTILDMMQLVAAAQSGNQPSDPMATVSGFVRDRPLDASFCLDEILAGRAGISSEQIDADRVGITGHSFGGWTTLSTTGRDPRIKAALPLAPAGGATPLVGAVEGPNPLEDGLNLDWDRDVPTLYLVAELDTLLPLDGIRGIYHRTRGATHMVVLQNADHMHFCDEVEQVHEVFRMMGGMMQGGIEGAPDFGSLLAQIKPAAELCPGEHAYTMLRGLGLAHMDAHLRDDPAAASLLAGDLQALMATRGVAVKVEPS